jgi:BRCT domain, a BRCA1 C-terminus domain
MTFTLREDSYQECPTVKGMLRTSFGEFADKEEIFEHMTRQIIENGGKVVPQNSKQASHFIVTEDGQIPQIWELLGQGGQVLDSMNRKIVHFRWVMQCIAKAQILEDNDQMHLLPLP